MSIYNSLRKSVATKISDIENTETFLWNKWLRAPTSQAEELEPLFSKIRKTEHIILSLDTPECSKFESRFEKIKLYKSSQRIYSIKTKTHTVFFGLGTPRMRNIDISYRQELRQFFAATVLQEDSSFYLLVEKKDKEKTKLKLNPNNVSIPVSIPYLIIKGSSDNKGTKDVSYSFREPASSRIDYYLKIQIRDKSFKDYNFSVIPNTKIDYYIRSNKTKKINYEPQIPEIIDHLSKLKPEVYNIALLNTLNELNLEGKEFQIKLDLLDYLPQIINNDFSELNKVKTISAKTRLEIPVSLDKNLFNTKLPVAVPHLQDKYHLKPLNKKEFTAISKFKHELRKSELINKSAVSADVDYFNKLLQPEINLSDAEKAEIYKYLYPYQIKGADFLSENARSYFADELGNGKTVECIAALRCLFKKKEIKSALIIAREYYINNSSIDLKVSEYYGWEGHLKKYGPEIGPIFITMDPEKLYTDFNKQSQVNIISYNLLMKGAVNDLVGLKKFKNFDCIIMDDAEILYSNYQLLEKLLKNCNPKYFWLLTNTPDKQFKEKIAAEFKFQNSFERSRDEITSQQPRLIRQDYWIDLNKKQKMEYDQALFSAKSQIDDVLSTGNPYRLQAKVFMLLHQLKQITNFSSEESVSRKTELFMIHLESIKRFNHRAIVFSQYDKFGLQKLIELLKQKNINHVSYLQNSSTNELELTVKKFESDKNITVFLINAQTDISNIRISNVNYIIHFDQWWIPAKQWQLEERLVVNNADNSSCSVINYLAQNSIDEKLRLKLFQKNLLIKNLLDTIGPDSFSKLITENDWLDIFEFPSDKKFNELQSSLTYEKIIQLPNEIFIDKLSSLLINFGYKVSNKTKEKTDLIGSIRGTYQREKRNLEFFVYCFSHSKKLDEQMITELALKTERKYLQGKIFIVSLNPKIISQEFTTQPNVTIINIEMIKKYFDIFHLM